MDDGLAVNAVPGLAGGYRGSINLDKRIPMYIKNPNGSVTVKTEESMSFDPVEGVSVTIPTVIDGKKVDERRAIDNYYKTGQYLDAIGRNEYPGLSDKQFYSGVVDKRAHTIHERQARHYPSDGLANMLGGM